jgi:UDP-N-acetylglucosamine 4,6-dehydratase
MMSGNDNFKAFDGKSVLITGGTGSFGRAFVKKLLNEADVDRLVIYSRDELKQHEMQQDLLAHPKSLSLRFFIGDVRDFQRLKLAMREVDFVVHAAALKHVPAAEYNPMECVKTNIIGAQNIISAAMEAGVRKVVALSTDKASAPVNLYGASKLVSDKLFVSANNLCGGLETRFSVVRYGNVIRSRGSVIPLFDRIKSEEKNVPFPITHEAMTRFLITLEQGVDFVLRSFDRMYGGEIFIPKIPSVRTIDIAAAIDPDRKIQIIGMRPGERLHEAMCTSDEAHLCVEFAHHYVIQPSLKFGHADINYSIDRCGGIGQLVPENFSYISNTNPHFLTIPEIRSLISA